MKLDPAYRPSVERSLEVFGSFSSDLVSRIAPHILKLRSLGEAPVTVLINSNGGTARVLDFIYGLLTAKGPSGKRPRIITVAVGEASSAAASLLALGDYAISYPKAAIHFHGLRYGQAEEVTMETASAMADQLRQRNRENAALISGAATERLAFHYARLNQRFQAVRESIKPGKNEPVSDIVCFALCLKQRVSRLGDRMIDQAITRYMRLRQLSKRVLEPARRTGKSGLAFESMVLKGMINHQVNRDKDSALDAESVAEITADYLLLRDYDVGTHNQLIKNIFERWGIAFFDKAERDPLFAALTSEDKNKQFAAFDKIDERIKPFCYFASSIWESLQEAENPLTPSDAYWLGAVDEVLDSDLPCLRDIAEAEPAQPDLPNSGS